MVQVKPKATYKAEQKTNEAALKRLQQLQKQPPHATPRACNARAKRGEMPYFRYTDGLRSFLAGGGNVDEQRSGAVDRRTGCLAKGDNGYDGHALQQFRHVQPFTHPLHDAALLGCLPASGAVRRAAAQPVGGSHGNGLCGLPKHGGECAFAPFHYAPQHASGVASGLRRGGTPVFDYVVVDVRHALVLRFLVRNQLFALLFFFFTLQSSTFSCYVS